MNNKDDKKKQEELARQQREDRARAAQTLTTAAAPSPLQTRLESGNMKFLDWEAGEGEYADKPIDVFDAPGLGPSLSIYRHAKEGQTGERQGIGALRMGLNATSPEAAANLAEQSKLRRDQDAAGQLEEAVARKSAEAHNSSIPLINLDQSRRLGVAGLAGNQAGQTQSLWSQFRVRPGWGQQLLNHAAQGAGQAATMFA